MKLIYFYFLQTASIVAALVFIQLQINSLKRMIDDLNDDL